MSKCTQRSLDWLIANYLPFLKKHGMVEQNIRNYISTWQNGNFKKGVGDYLWFIFNQLLSEVPKQTSSEKLQYKYNQDIYLQMANFLRKYENRNANHVMRLFFKNQLLLHELETPYLSGIEIISGQCCTHCDSLNGKIIPSAAEVINGNYLASKYCKRALGCNCCYAHIPVRDKNDRLIKKVIFGSNK